MKELKKHVLTTAIILAILFIIKKIKTSFFKSLDSKIKALGFPALFAIIGMYVVKQKELKEPIIIGSIITFVAGVLDVTESEKFKIEDLGLSGDSYTHEFKNFDELAEFAKANLPAVNGEEIDESLYGETIDLTDLLLQNNANKIETNGIIEDLNGDFEEATFETR